MCLLCALTPPAGAQVGWFEGCVAFERQILNSALKAQLTCRGRYEAPLPTHVLTLSPGAVVNTSRTHVITRVLVRRVGGVCDGAVARQARALWPGHRRRGPAEPLAWIPPQTGEAIAWRTPCRGGAGERAGRDFRLVAEGVRGIRRD